MAHRIQEWVKAPVPKPNSLILISHTRTVERENQFLQIVLRLTHTHSHINVKHESKGIGMADTDHCEQKGNGLSILRKLIKAWSLALVQILYHVHVLLVSVGDARREVYVQLFYYLMTFPSWTLLLLASISTSAFYYCLFMVSKILCWFLAF